MTQPSADDILARLDEQTQQAIARADQARAFRARLDALVGRGRSGMAEVTVDLTGLILTLELPEDLGGANGTEVGRDVMAAIRVATLDVARQAKERTEATYGEGSAITQKVERELADRYGEESA